MNVLIVYAHPEPQSFNGAMLDVAKRELAAQGHSVTVSDLYAMGFDPVASERDFHQRRFSDRLLYDREQKFNHAQGSLRDDIAREIEKLVACDLLILHFPLWWFSLPAILKGWVDRVFANGVAYGAGRRYDTGGLRGKRAMVVTSTAAWEGMCAPDGLLGDINVILWPIQNGILAYAGCTVLPPVVNHAVAFVDDAARARYLDDYAQRLRTIDTTESLFFHPLADFGDDWKLKPGIDPNTVGQRRPS